MHVNNGPTIINIQNYHNHYQTEQNSQVGASQELVPRGNARAKGQAQALHDGEVNIGETNQQYLQAEDDGSVQIDEASAELMMSRETDNRKQVSIQTSRLTKETHVHLKG